MPLRRCILLPKAIFQNPPSSPASSNKGINTLLMAWDAVSCQNPKVYWEHNNELLHIS